MARLFTGLLKLVGKHMGLAIILSPFAMGVSVATLAIISLLMFWGGFPTVLVFEGTGHRPFIEGVYRGFFGDLGRWFLLIAGGILGFLTLLSFILHLCGKEEVSTEGA
ncbi:MAG: hypothetical protein H6760_02645 [Candidatus Nomurabacteria bacterium]|nr:MAG: hypothetical protein H6760_02645 [Candidatus Nomurabacteria bacterium]